MLKKYQEIYKKSEYVSIDHVINDLWQILREQRIQKIPKDER